MSKLDATKFLGSLMVTSSADDNVLSDAVDRIKGEVRRVSIALAMKQWASLLTESERTERGIGSERDNSAVPSDLTASGFARPDWTVIWEYTTRRRAEDYVRVLEEAAQSIEAGFTVLPHPAHQAHDNPLAPYQPFDELGPEGDLIRQSNGQYAVKGDLIELADQLLPGTLSGPLIRKYLLTMEGKPFGRTATETAVTHSRMRMIK